MQKILLAFVLAFSFLAGFAQYKMHPLEELINTTDPGWPLVKQRIDAAKNKTEILPADSMQARDALYKTQVTTWSVMGAIVYETGGILIDHGWIRILGSGSPGLQRTLPGWNKGKAFNEWGDRPACFLVADDAAGGYFAINYGLFGDDTGNIYYLSPDTLEWESLEMTYDGFIAFCLNGDLDQFYEGIRWTTWQKDILALKADDVFHIYPPLWSKEGHDIEKSIKNPVPEEEYFAYIMELRKQMGLDKKSH